MGYLTVEEKKNFEKRKKKMCDMRLKGATYKEIADKFGISRQRVLQIIGKPNKAYFKIITQKRCIYPGLRDWMNENKVSFSELTRKIYGIASPDNQTRISLKLNRRVRLDKVIIDKILVLCGLTYETAFNGSKGKITNYERIQRMSVDEIANYIYLNIDMLCDEICKHSVSLQNGECSYGDNVESIHCKECIKKWLKSECLHKK